MEEHSATVNRDVNGAMVEVVYKMVVREAVL